MKINELFDILRNGESDTVEFKSKFNKDINREIVAFANTLGGLILIGISDDGKIVGTDVTDQEIFDVLSAIVPPIKLKLERISVSGKKIVLLQIDKSKYIHTYRNVAYIRIGSNNKPLDPREFVEKASESLLIFWGNLPACNISCIDNNSFSRFMKARHSVRNLPIVKLKDYLTGKGLIVKNKITNSALLFFGKDISRYLYNTKIVYLRFNRDNTERIEFSDNLVTLLPKLETHVKSMLRRIDLGYRGWKRKIVYDYPFFALREAVINAIAHRNYFDPGSIFIKQYPNRIEIENPGSFPPGVTVDNPMHKPRNPKISDMLFEYGYIEKYGSGINKIKKEVSEHPLVEVEFDVQPYLTRVIFRKTSKMSLDELSQHILDILRNNKKMSSAELSAELSASKKTIVSKLNYLIAIGLVEKIGNGPYTRYVLK